MIISWSALEIALLELHQLNLFADTPIGSMLESKPETLVMGAPALVRWKSQIYDYQQQAKASKPLQQTALFDLAPAHCAPDSIDPFSLRLSPRSFYRLPADSPGNACIYFVIDSAAQLLLYIGETCRSNLRSLGSA